MEVSLTLEAVGVGSLRGGELEMKISLTLEAVGVGSLTGRRTGNGDQPHAGGCRGGISYGAENWKWRSASRWRL